MFKKLAIAGASSALLLATIVPAFAEYNGHRGGHHSRDNGSSVSVENNSRLTNNVLTVANTGLNRVSGGDSHHDNYRHGGGDRNNGGSITTGNATAYGTVGNNVNDTTVDLCGCIDDVKVSVENNSRLTNNVLTVANTGLNGANSGRIRTGGAYADSLVENVVNTTVVGGGSE